MRWGGGFLGPLIWDGGEEGSLLKFLSQSLFCNLLVHPPPSLLPDTFLSFPRVPFALHYSFAIFVLFDSTFFTFLPLCHPAISFANE